VIVLDTTVLVYAVGVEHALREPCRRLIGAARDGTISASTTVEVIQELAHVRARRRGRADATELALSFGELLAPLIIVDADDLGAGLELFQRQDDLGAFDCVLAAVAVRRGADALVSADGAFAGVDGLRHIEPGTPDLLASLARGRT